MGVHYIVMDLRNPAAEPFAVLRVDTEVKKGDGLVAVVQSIHWEKTEAQQVANAMNEKLSERWAMDEQGREQNMTTPDELAQKIAKKAAETLARLELEMTILKWPAEFRAIMWNAVAHDATLRANEQSATPPAQRKER